MGWRGKISLRAKRRGRDRGQTLILIMLAMPLFFALMSLVVDGGNIFVHKRNIQVAADAAALAMSQSINLATSPATCPASCVDEGRAYAKKNGIDVDATSPSWHKCNDADPAHPTDTNCWAFPYVNRNDVTHPHYDQVEVRLRAHVTTFIAGVVGIYSANVSARAVGGANPVYAYSTTPGTTIPGTTVLVTNPGDTHTTTDPDTISGGSGIAFAMSRACNAISYSGAGSGTWNDAIAAGFPGSASVLGAFATNGGVDFSGNAPKKMTWLGFDQTRCGPLGFPASPPSGTNQCKARAWETPPGSGTDSNNLCAQTLVNLNQNNTLPINWPLPPPPQPTPRSGTWTPASDYFSKCINLGNSGAISFSTAGHPPGIYCVSGSGTTLSFSSVGDLTGSDGYTFFALGGATISVSGNTNKLKFYWPSACGAGTRPTTRASSYPCPGLNRTITGYDPFTLFYATNPSSTGGCAVCLQGNGNSLTGDIFAPMPNAFPPTPGLTQTGGLVKINGGSLASGSGFIESWNLQIAGNTGTYSGTGTSIVIPGATHTTQDTGTVSTSIVTGTTIAGSVQVSTSGTTVGLGE